jgi:hypothetical protein
MYKFNKTRVMKNAEPKFQIKFNYIKSTEFFVINLRMSSLASLNTLMSEIEIERKACLLKGLDLQDVKDKYFQIFDQGKSTSQMINVPFKCNQTIKSISYQKDYTEEEINEMFEDELTELNKSYEYAFERICNLSFNMPIDMYMVEDEDSFQNDIYDKMERLNYKIEGSIARDLMELEFNNITLNSSDKKSSNKEAFQNAEKLLQRLKKDFANKRAEIIKRKKEFKGQKTIEEKKKEYKLRDFEIDSIYYYDEEELKYKVEVKKLSDMIADF